MAELITPQLKDVVLGHFVDNNPLGDHFLIDERNPVHNVDGRIVLAMFNQFEKLGFVTSFAPSQRGRYYKINIEAHDFLQRGAFYGQEILFQKSVEDLLTELRKPESPLPNNPLGQTEKLTTIIANIASFLAIIKS